MKKNDVIELKIVDLSVDGSGIGKLVNIPEQESSMTFFVKDALVGDRIRAKVIKMKKAYGYARLLELIEPSPDRVEPKCQVHRQCGGCQIQALSYEKQLEYKQNKIQNNLIRIGGFDAGQLQFDPIIGMKEPFRYRNKAQFPVGRDKNGKLAVGFYAARTHAIIPVEDCCLGVPQNKEVISRILAWMERYKIEPYDEKNGTGLIRHILIRYGFTSKQLMVCIVINGKSIPKAAQLTEKLWELDGITNISISINEQRNNVIMGNEVKTIWGKDFIEDFIGKVKFQISPLSFYQVNPVQTEILYRKVLEFAGLTGQETVWDLYCGIGTISLFLAQQAKKVYGIEIVPQAVEDAKKNAKLNGIENAEFIVGKAQDVLEKLWVNDSAADDKTASNKAAGNKAVGNKAAGNKAAENKAAGNKAAGNKAVGNNEKDGIGKDWRPQVVVVDPPRKGCGEKLLQAILKAQPERVVYVSCNSATLARDLKVLCEGGYELVRGQGVDLFCQTVHVEAIVLLSHKSPDSIINVTVEFGEGEGKVPLNAIAERAKKY